MNKQLHTILLFVLILISLIACRDYDVENPQQSEVISSDANSRTAYMSLIFSIGSNTPSTRSDGTSQFIRGQWVGNDMIESATVYIFQKAADGNFFYERTLHYTTDELEPIASTAANPLQQYRLKKAIKTRLGTKKVFVIANPTAPISERIEQEVQKANFNLNANDFLQLLQRSDWAPFATDPYPTTQQTTTRANELVRQKDGKDIILMTGMPADIQLEKNDGNMAEKVAEQNDVNKGKKNTVSLILERAVARVLVTYGQNAALAEPFNPSAINTNAPRFIFRNESATHTEDDILAYVSDPTWTVAQGANSLSLIKVPGYNVEFNFSTEGAQQIPVELSSTSNLSISVSNFWGESLADYASFSEHYDYSGLWVGQGNSKINRGHNIQKISQFQRVGSQTATSSINALLRETNGYHCEYLLPTTQNSGINAQLANTPYILVRALITPIRYLNDNGVEESHKNDAQPGRTFYYDPIHNAFALSPQGLKTKYGNEVAGYIQKYENGIAYYIVMINANNASNPQLATASPINRNQFYHVFIEGIDGVGLNWNPLVPYPQNTSADPLQKVFPSNPHSPDDRPTDNPDEPLLPHTRPSDNIFPFRNRENQDTYTRAAHHPSPLTSSSGVIVSYH